MRGVWIAYHNDWSGFAVFSSEIEALRYAVMNGCSIGFAEFGQELGGSRYPAEVPKKPRAPRQGTKVEDAKSTAGRHEAKDEAAG